MKLSSIATHLISGESQLLRRFSTATSPAPANRVSYIIFLRLVLYKKLSAMGTTSEKVSEILHELRRKGEHYARSDLLFCVRKLRKYGHYHHSLEILEWMDSVRCSHSVADYALHLDLLCKAKGIHEAEKFFNNIPHDAKDQYIYGSLLNCYCTHMMTDEALALCEKMDELKYVPNTLAFNNVMSLCLKVGKPEKVSYFVEHMKQRNIQLDNHTYYIWIQSYRHLVDLEGVERVMHEVQEQDSVKDDRLMYTNLAAVYIEFGQSEKAKTALNKVEELLDNQNDADREAYRYQISMYSSIGNLDSVNQAWLKLKSRFKVLQNACYLTMLRALSKLDDIDGLTSFLKEWELSHKIYDDRVPAVVISAYLRHDMFEEAQQLLKDVEDKAPWKIKIAHVHFMNYFLEKLQFDSALKHMEAAMAANWKTPVKKFGPFFEHFKEEKDVDSAEEFCRILEKFHRLDSQTYLWLLQTYAAAGKTSPNMRQRMEQNGVDISIEHQELLQAIC